jgi:hypothetical protein
LKFASWEKSAATSSLSGFAGPEIQYVITIAQTDNRD